MNHSTHLGAIAFTVGRACGQSARGIPDTVVATMESDDLVPPGDALGEFDRGLQRIAAALGEEGDAVATQTVGGDFGEFGGQLGASGAVDFQGVHQHFGLVADGLHHFRVTPAHAADTDAGGQVDVGVAVRVFEGCAERPVHGHRHASAAACHRLGIRRQRQGCTGFGAGKGAGDNPRSIREVQGFKGGFTHDGLSGMLIQVGRSSAGQVPGR